MVILKLCYGHIWNVGGNIEIPWLKSTVPKKETRSWIWEGVEGRKGGILVGSKGSGTDVYAVLIQWNSQQSKRKQKMVQSKQALSLLTSIEMPMFSKCECWLFWRFDGLRIQSLTRAQKNWWGPPKGQPTSCPLVQNFPYTFSPCRID